MADRPTTDNEDDATNAYDPTATHDEGHAAPAGRVTMDLGVDDETRDTLDGFELPPRFEVRRIVGRGAMGIVVEVVDRNLGREVAVKFLAASRKGTPAYRVRFLREAKAAAMLRHPNIVTVHDVDPDRDFIVMELVRGESLRACLKRERQLPVDELRRVGLALLDALAAAHDAGIIHRDVKPGNILIDTAGVVKLVDFGIASFGDRDLTSSGVRIGTPAYMAPEQLRGRVADARADLYAVGATLFEAATGVQLHSQLESTRDVAGAVLAATGDAALAAALARATAELPGDRFPDARAFAAALASPEPVVAAPEPVAPATDPGSGATIVAPVVLPRTHRRRTAVAIAIGLLAVTAVVAVVALRGTRSDRGAAPTGSRTVAILPFEDHTGEPRLDFAASGLSHILTTSLRKIPGLRVIGYYELLDRVPDPAAPPAAWLAAARALGADVIVRGALFAEPAGVRLTLELDASEGATLGRIERMTSVDDVPAATRGLAGDVARAVLGRTTESVPGEVRKLEVDRELQLGIAALERQDLTAADAHLQAAELKAPDLAEIHYYRAMLDWWLSRDAHPALTRALAGALDDAQRGFMEGLRLLYDLKSLDAIAKFRELAARFPDHRDIMYGLFEALYHGGQVAASMEVYRQLGARFPRFRLGLAHALGYYIAHGDEEGLGWAITRLDPGSAEATRWQAQALVSRRAYDDAIALLRRHETDDPELDRQLAQVYVLAGQLELATDLAAGWATTDVARFAPDLLGLANAQGRTGDAQRWSERAAGAVELTSGEARERGWLALAAIELPDAPLARLARIKAELRGGSRSNEVLARLLLARATADRTPMEPALSSPHPEVVAIAKASLAEWAGDWRAAAIAWQSAVEHAAGSDFAIVEWFAAARAWHTAGAPQSVLDACDAVIHPRAFTWAWGGAIGPCLRWSAEAATELGRPKEARRHWERVLALRVKAAPDDPIVRAAQAALAILPRDP